MSEPEEDSVVSFSLSEPHKSECARISGGHAVI